MAFFQTEEDQKQQDQQQTATGEKVLSGQGGEIQSNQAGQAAGVTAQAPKTSSGFTNLVKYVNANKGNDAEMGATIQSGVQRQVDDTATKSGEFSTGAQKTVESATIKDNGVIAGLQNNPTEVKKDDFTKQYNAVWEAPQDASQMEGYQPIADTMTKLSNQAENGDSFEGRQGMLVDSYGRPTYTKGEQRLDSFILGSGEGGQKALSNVKDIVGKSSTDWGNVVSGVNDAIATGKKTTEDTQANTAKAYDAAVRTKETGFDKTLNDLSAEAASQAAAIKKIEGDLTSKDPQVRAQAFKEIGLTPDQGEYLMSIGYKPEDLTSAAKARSLGDAVSKKDVDSYLALMGLTDSTGAYDFSQAGGTSKLYNVAQPQLAAARDIYGINNTVNQKVSEANKKNDDDLALANAVVKNMMTNTDASAGAIYGQDKILQQMGIDGDAIALARDLGIDASQFITAGSKFSAGDVLSGAEQGSWNNLMSTLGLKPQSFKKTGSTVGFDKEGLAAAVSAALALRGIQQSVDELAYKMSLPGALSTLIGDPAIRGINAVQAGGENVGGYVSDQWKNVINAF